MAKRGRPKKEKPQTPIRVPHELHLAALVKETIRCKAEAKDVTADIQAKVKAAKKNAGLDPHAFNLRLLLATLTPEKANRKAEMIVLAIYRGGFLGGDLLNQGPDLSVWANEVESQYRHTDADGVDNGMNDSPVFNGTKAGADTEKDDFGAGDEERRKAAIAAAEEAAMGNVVSIDAATGEEAAKRLRKGIKRLGDAPGTYQVQ